MNRTLPAVTDFGPTDFTYLHADTDASPAHWAMYLDLADGPHLTLEAIADRVCTRVSRFELFRIGVSGGRAEAPTIVVAESIDPAEHTAEVTFTDDADLHRQIALILDEPLPQPRPYWTVTLLTAIDGNRQGLLLKVHHSLSDGIAGAAFAALLADDDGTNFAEFERFATSPRFRVDAVDPDVLAASRTAFEKQWMDGAHGRDWPSLTESGRREVALISVSTRELRATARRHGASVHEFLIAAIGQTISQHPPVAGRRSENVRVTLPVTLDPEFRHTGNAVAISLLNLSGADTDLQRQLVKARAELAITEVNRLELALAAGEESLALDWATQRHIVTESMKRMSPDAHIGINPGFTRVRSVFGRPTRTLTPLSPLLGYSFSVTGLILGSRTSLGVVTDAQALAGYPERFAAAFTEVLAAAATD